MEGWGKIGVQSASVLYPNSCYNESCYIEVQVYVFFCFFFKISRVSTRIHEWQDMCLPPTDMFQLLTGIRSSS